MKLKIFLLAILLSARAEGQVKVTTPAPPQKEKWDKSLIIRKGLETKDDKDKPGTFSLTWPQDGKASSYLVNAAAGLSFTHIVKDRSNLELTPSFAYNRNSLVKKEQHNLKGLFSLDWYLGRGNTTKEKKNYFWAYATVQYMRDKIDSSSSFFTTAYFTWLAKNVRHIFLNEYTNLGHSGLLIYAGPSIGIEYQNRFDVKKPDTKGNITRFFFGSDLRLAFKDGKKIAKNGGIKKRELGTKLFELTFNYGGRQELASNLIKKEGYTCLLKTEFSYFPLETDLLSLGLQYSAGQDPISAIDQQNFWQFAVKLKLDYPKK